MTAMWRAALRYQQGWVSDAAADAERVMDAGELGWTSDTTWSASVLAQSRLELGDLDGAAQAIHLGMRGDHKRLPHGYLLYASGEVALASNDPEAAFHDFTAAGTHLREYSALENPAGVPWKAGAGRALHALGEETRAAELTDAGLASAGPPACRTPSASRCVPPPRPPATRRGGWNYSVKR